MEETIPEFFFRIANKFHKKPALFCKKDGVYNSTTFLELKEKIKNFAQKLRDLGIKKGDKIAILSENRPEWVVSDLAAMLAGAILAPIHTTLSSFAMQNILNHSEAKILIVSNQELLEKIIKIQGELTFLEKIIIIEKSLSYPGTENLNKKILEWDNLAGFSSVKDNDFPELSAEDVCSIIYTSGTTGEPKGVMLSHKNFLSNIEAVNEAIPVKTNDVFLSFLPLSHVFERLAGYYAPLLNGAAIAYAESVKKLPENLKEVRPTVLVSVPRVFEKFEDAIWDKINESFFQKIFFLWALKQRKNSWQWKIADILVFKKIRKQLGGRLRLAISGGAPLEKKLAKFFWKIGILILEGYGLTETSPVISVNTEKEFKLGTVGKPLKNVKVSISPEKEVLFQGPNLTKGYFKNEEFTRQAIDDDGWFHTGDLGFIDNDGYLTIIGRKKEMIVTSGGKNVWPEQIESQLNRDKYISQSMLIGNKRKFISALIVPDWKEIKIFLKKNNLPVKGPKELVSSPELNLFFQQRINAINENLALFEKIVRFKLLEHEFSQDKEELTPTLKLRRHIIEKRCQKEIEEMYLV